MDIKEKDLIEIGNVFELVEDERGLKRVIFDKKYELKGCISVDAKFTGFLAEISLTFTCPNSKFNVEYKYGKDANK